MNGAAIETTQARRERGLYERVGTLEDLFDAMVAYTTMVQEHYTTRLVALDEHIHGLGRSLNPALPSFAEFYSERERKGMDMEVAAAVHRRYSGPMPPLGGRLGSAVEQRLGRADEREKL